MVKSSFEYESIPNIYQGIPSLIESPCGDYGSGFCLVGKEYVYLITAAHLIYDKEDRMICGELDAKFWLYDPNNRISGRKTWNIVLTELSNDCIKKVSSHDIVAICVGKQSKSDGTNISFKYGAGVSEKEVEGTGIVIMNHRNEVTDFEHLKIGNEAFTAGYPQSLGLQEENESPQLDYQSPLLRKGIIAGKNKDLKTIIIDCPAFPGNSGGPVIEIVRCGNHCNKNHFRLIGVVSQLIPFVETWTSDQFDMSRIEVQNSGYSVVIPIDTLLDQID